MSAAKVLNNIGRLGIGVAVAGGVVSNALYNGMFLECWSFKTSPKHQSINFIWRWNMN